jgi:type II secretory pathway component PulL
VDLTGSFEARRWLRTGRIARVAGVALLAWLAVTF